MAAKQITDDDAFDERGLLKDGRTLRIGMMMADGLSDVQRAVAATQQALGDGINTNDAREQAYIEYDRQQQDAWRMGQPDPAKPVAGLTLDELYALHDEEESNRWRGPGHNVVAPAVARPMTYDQGQAAKAEAYAEYDRQQENAWRRDR